MKKKLYIVILIAVILFGVLCMLFTRNYGKACDTYAKEGVRARLTLLINETVAENLSRFSDEYSDISVVSYRPDGTVGSITIDSFEVSALAARLSNEIYLSIENVKPEFGIPFGNALGLRSLSGKGFDIPVTVVPVGAVAHDLKSEFISGGLNQTLHRVSIRFSVTVSCLTPFHDSTSMITSEVCVAETVIVGTVPGILWSR